MTDTELLRSYWIDRRLQNLPRRPWRKVHLDYHNSQHMPRVGDAFEPSEFGDRLAQAHVDSIVVFAKDMHGYFYYPSDYGPVHPGLSVDLLGQQVAACRERNIKVYAYYCVTWDNYLAERHPEWLVWKRDRTTYLPKFDETPGWTALCLSNPDFVDLVLEHSHECITRYELDGIWYDMPLPIGGECFCRNCLASIRAAGADPFDVGAQRAHKQQLLVRFMRRTHALAHTLRPSLQVDQNNQTRLGLGARAPFLDNIDIEALPTAFWGYLYYPTNVRYARTFGVSVCGMTGRFQRSWADFGGLKHPHQLRAELAGIVAHGAQCDIGDQLPPSGRLDRAVYETIGACYAEIKQLEPYLEKAAPVVEAAIVVRGLPLDDIGRADENNTLSISVLGATKLLMEEHIQFDIVDADGDIERYRLLVLPDALPVDEGLVQQLRAYVKNGGRIIASHEALRLHGTEQIWAEELGLTYQGESPFTPVYLKLRSPLLADLPDYEYALYDGAAQWQTENEEVVLANLGEPLFQRSAEHYTSHNQTPFDHVTNYAAVIHRDRIAAAAFPLAASYYRHGYWIYREIFRRLVRTLLPVRLVETNAPISAEVTVTHQAATGESPERWMVHVVNFAATRRTPEHVEYLEDPVTLHNVQVRLVNDVLVDRAYIAKDGAPLVLREANHAWEVTVPEVHISTIVVFESRATA